MLEGRVERCGEGAGAPAAERDDRDQQKEVDQADAADTADAQNRNGDHAQRRISASAMAGSENTMQLDSIAAATRLSRRTAGKDRNFPRALPACERQAARRCVQTQQDGRFIGILGRDQGKGCERNDADRSRPTSDLVEIALDAALDLVLGVGGTASR